MKKYLFRLKYIIAFQVITALISIVGIASMPYVVKLLFDYDFSKGAGGMIWIIFLYLLSIAVGMFFEYCSQRTVWKFRQRFYCLVRQDLFDALLKKQYVDFKKHDLSEYLSFFQNDIDVFPFFVRLASGSSYYFKFVCKSDCAEADRKTDF